MSEQENVAIVKQALAAFQRGDLQTFLNFLRRYGVSSTRCPPLSGVGGPRRGRAQLAESAAGVVEVIELCVFEAPGVHCPRHKVVVLVF